MDNNNFFKCKIKTEIWYILFEHKHFFYCESKKKVVREGFRVFILGDVLGMVPGNQLWVALLEQGRLDKLTSKGAFQPELFSVSVKSGGVF